MESQYNILNILQENWGYDSFRPGQTEIIESALSGKDTLALMPTGGGKSICFQVPALAKDGICLVISPLIALIKDQVQNLNKKGIKALAVCSGMSYNQIDAALDNAIYGDYKFLYVSPERLQTPLFKGRAGKMNINFLVVDEAHCISQWGYDFRPSYLEIKNIKSIIGDVPIILLPILKTAQVSNKLHLRKYLAQLTFSILKLTFILLIISQCSLSLKKYFSVLTIFRPIS